MASCHVTWVLEMGIEPNPNRTHRTRTLFFVKTNRTERTGLVWLIEPNWTRTQYHGFASYRHTSYFHCAIKENRKYTLVVLYGLYYYLTEQTALQFWKTEEKKKYREWPQLPSSCWQYQQLVQQVSRFSLFVGIPRKWAPWTDAAGNTGETNVFKVQYVKLGNLSPAMFLSFCHFVDTEHCFNLNISDIHVFTI